MVEARYKAIYLVYILVNALSMVLLNNKLVYGIPISAFLLFLAAIYLIFLIVYRPYRYSFTVHGFTLIVNQTIFMITLSVITMINLKINLKESYLLIFCYVLLGFCVIIALLTIVRVILDFRFGARQIKEEVKKEIKEIKEI